MATFSQYNHTEKLLANGEITYTTLKVMLLDNTTAFDATHTTLAQASDSANDEVDGSGWSTGGETIANGAVTITTTNDATLDGDDISVTASGGAIGPASALVIYDDTHASDAPLWHYEFDSPETAGVGTDFNVNFNVSGIHTWTIT